MEPARDLYAATADALVERIKALIPAHPEILRMDSPWDLFAVPGFDCGDLRPSFMQATWALRAAQQAHESAPAASA